jgi:ABC-type branched-subunit amino acid transport system permease subunit
VLQCKVIYVRNFLLGTVLPVALFGITTLLHWQWTGRSRPLAISFRRVLLFVAKWLGTVLAMLGGVLVAIAAGYLIHGQGSPFGGALLGLLTIGIGLTIRWVAGQWPKDPGR